MKRIAIDIETSMDHNTIHLAVTQDIDTGEVKVWKAPTGLWDYLKDATLIAAHNGTRKNTMTDDDIIMMATKAGFEPSSWPNCLDIQELREFAYLIAEKSREERAVDCQDKDSWGPTAAKVIRRRGKSVVANQFFHYRSMLIRYINHVGEEEGTSFLGTSLEHSKNFTDAEKEELRVLDEESQIQSSCVLKPVAWLRNDGFKAMTDTEKQAWITADEGIEGYWSELVKDYTIPLYK